MKIRPNQPCPCGSGRKYKKCHGSPSLAQPPRAQGPSAEDCLHRGRQLQATGRLEDAEALYQAALGIAPAHADAWFALGGLAEQAGDLEVAEQCYARLVQHHPRHARGLLALGHIQVRTFSLGQARESYLRAAEIDPTLPGLWLNLGNLEKYLGRFHQAIECYRRDIELVADPEERARRHSNLLIALHYDETLSHEALFQAHVDWAERHARRWYPPAPDWTNVPDPDRPLRIGYLSGSVNGLILGHFLQGVLSRHDQGHYALYAYSSTRMQDEYTARLRAQCHHWVELVGLGDAEAADRIRADAIDILVDIDGHSPAGRPLVLARRPAPVLVEWLDYFDTTGMAVVDYLLTDPYTTPADSPQRFTETPWRLPHTRLCYTPPDHAPPVAPPPSQGRRALTFGSFNRQDKLHPALLARWAEILRILPEARLLIKNRALQSAAVRETLHGAFASHGIEAARVELRGPSPHADLLADYAEVDIALDTFPYNGGLTTCECLWMGVPIVALEAERMIGRQTAALLRLLGLEDWVAATPEAYVRLAVEKARHPNALTSLRAKLRPGMAASPLCDATRFTRDLEQAYRAMWRRYCARSADQASLGSADLGMRPI